MILSISDIKKIRKNYFYYSIFLVIFAFVYELFSHSVYSNYMIFAFLIPLIGGYCASFFIKKGFSRTGILLYNLGIVTLSIGSVFKGVLEIYGTTNRLSFFYLVTGLLLVISGIIMCFLERK